MTKFLLQLFQDNRYGTYSQSKFWSNVANLIATIVFVRHAFMSELTPEMLATYISLVGLQRLGAKFIDNREFYFNNRKRNEEDII